MHEEWSAKSFLSTANLSVKYAIINKIKVAYWAIVNHYSSITPLLTRLFDQLGTRVAFDFGEFLINQILKQPGFYGVKLHIAFPFLITWVMMKQKPNILIFEDVASVSESLLNFSYKLFIGNHVPYIVLPNLPDFGIIKLTTCGNMPKVLHMSETAKDIC